MIEVQIKDKKLFDKFKSQARQYCSELTGVCVFDDSMLEQLQLAGLCLEHGKEKEKKDPTITMRGDIMCIENSTPDILSFVGNTKVGDTEVSVFYMDRVYMLLAAKILVADDKFKNYYSKLHGREPLSVLLYGNRRLRGENPSKIIGELLEIDPNEVTLDMCPFTKDEDYICKEVSYMTEDVQFLSDLVRNKSGKGFHINARGKETGRKYMFTYYTMPSQIDLLMMYEGGEVRMAIGATKNFGGKTVSASPVIVPKGMKFAIEQAVRPRSRKIKADVWRAIFYEYQYRMSLNDKNDIDRSRTNTNWTSLIEQGVFRLWSRNEETIKQIDKYYADLDKEKQTKAKEEE